MLLSVGDVSTKACDIKFCNFLHWEAADCAMKRTAYVRFLESDCCVRFLLKVSALRIKESKHLSYATKLSSRTKMVCKLPYLLWSVCFARGLRVILVMKFLFCKRVENHPGYEVSVLQVG